MTTSPTLRQIVAALDAAYDPRTAESWDAVGLVCGDPEAPVRRVLFAVDPVAAVVDEAEEFDADLVVTHHPLFLTPVHGVPADDPKGRIVHRLLAGGRGLFVAHTNADVADPGVSDALARALGLSDLRPLEPLPEPRADKLVTFVPHADAEKVFDAMCAAGAGAIGDYDRASFRSDGTGTFRPGPGARPAIGTVGAEERVDETRPEVLVPHARLTAVVEALLGAHPYEEVAYDVFERVPSPSSLGHGRIGVLPGPATFEAFAATVAAALPVGIGGVRAAGDPDRQVRTVAVCGGAGDSFLGAAAAAGVDAYVTGDLRHHRVSEHLEAGGPPVVDATHYGTEWPWLVEAAERLERDCAALGTTVDTRVSTTVTDPWTVHRGSRD